MYISDSFTLNIPEVKSNYTYDDILSCCFEYYDVLANLDAEIQASRAIHMLASEDGPQQPDQNNNNNNTNANNTGNTNGNAVNNTGKFGDKVKVYLNKIRVVIEKIINALIGFAKSSMAKFSELFAKMRENIQKAGVKSALDDLKANGNSYKFDTEYFNNKVTNATFTSPTSKDIIDAFMKGLTIYNKLLDIIKNVKNDTQVERIDFSGVDNYKANELKNILEKVKVTGKDLEATYFSNNLQKSLGLVQGLFDSIDPKKAELVTQPFNNEVVKFGNNANTLSKQVSSELSSLNSDPNAAASLRTRYAAIQRIASEVAKLANMFNSTITGMHMSRLKIINTFLKLWTKDNDKQTVNSDNTANTEAKPETKQNVDQATSAA